MLTTFYQYAVRRTTGITGDEPHYLMTVLSLVTDGDFDETKNYAEGGPAKVGFPALHPQARMPDGRILPEHGPGFPLFLVVPEAILGFAHLKYFLMAVMVAAALLLCAATDRLLGNPRDGTIAGLVLILLPVWQVFGPRIYPEVTAGTIALIVYMLVTKTELGPWSASISGALIGLLPVLYLRFSSFALFLLVIALLNPRVRRSAGFVFWLGVVLLAGASLILSIYGAEWHRAAPGSTGLTFSGSWERFWRLWFHRGHGIAVLGLMLFAYAYEFALAPTDSGESPPGRFLCAISDAALLVIVYWIAPAGRILLARATSALALAGVGAAILIHGIWNQTPAWLALPWYQDRFTIGWPLPSFTWRCHAHAGQSAPLGALLLAGWALTASAGALVHVLKTRRPTTLQSTTG